jgi:hypothetical protein
LHACIQSNFDAVVVCRCWKQLPSMWFVSSQWLCEMLDVIYPVHHAVKNWQLQGFLRMRSRSFRTDTESRGRVLN